MVCYADPGRNQGAVNNLCQNLSAACTQGDNPSCDAYKTTGCACDESGVCWVVNQPNPSFNKFIFESRLKAGKTFIY